MGNPKAVVLVAVAAKGDELQHASVLLRADKAIVAAVRRPLARMG